MRRALVWGCSMLGLALSVACQGRGPTAADRASARPTLRAKPANLRVLPKDISLSELDGLMHQYGAGLGVKCGYCHAQNPQTGQLDYASDENPRKQTARVMIAMLREINDKYLAQLGDPRYPVLVTCGNCHQGQTNPPDFEPGGAAVSER